MRPLTVHADMLTPPVSQTPILLDGLLYFALGAQWAEAGQGVDPVALADAPLPLARVDGRGGQWWHACSQQALYGSMARRHYHRRAALELARELGDFGSINVAAGADKALRVPIYYRPGMLVLRWTAIGNPGPLGALLARVSQIGKYSAWGFGMVARWTVETDTEAPGIDRYATDVTLRHLPVGAAAAVRGAIVKASPLRPPYWDRARATQCIQVIR
jgi:CRISPR type IV-associated protein Csf3